MRRLISSGSPFEERIGFSRAVRVGDRVLVSGTAPILADGGCPEDPGDQARRCFEIVAEALADAGGSLADVVRTRQFIVDRADADSVMNAHRECFTGVRPASTMVVVAGFLDPRWRVEIEAEAVIPSRVHAQSSRRYSGMTKWLAMLMACVAFGLVAVGCGDDDDEGGGGADTERPAPAGGGKEKEKAAGGKTAEVTLENIAFEPASLTIEKGTTVTWTNEDSAGHDVTKTGGPGPDFSSGEPGGMQQGDAYEEKINTPGKIEYVCTVHPNMKASITVTQ